MGLRSDPLGDLDVLHPAAVRRVDQRTSGGKQQPLVPKRRMSEVPLATSRLPQGNLRLDGRVLEEERRRQTSFLGDPPLPATQEPGIHARSKLASIEESSCRDTDCYLNYSS